VFEPTGSRRDAASTIFNLSDYRVIDALEVPGHARRVEVEATSPPGCPVCGVISTRVHSRRQQRIRDVPVAGAVDVIWCKRRWFCDEQLCGRGTFAESTIEVPARARSTLRLGVALVAAVVISGRAVSETARAHGVSWWMVQTAVTAAVLALPAVDAKFVKRLGVDEHRYRSVRFYRTETGAWARYEPWMSTIVDVSTGQVLGIVDGRGSAGVGAWLEARPVSWLAQVEVVAIDPSAAFRKALRTHLPCAAVSVDTFHLVQLSNQCLTGVRQRLVREQKDAADAWSIRPGRTGDCCCAGPTRSHPAGGRAWRRCFATTTRPTSSAPRGASRNSSAGCSRPPLSRTRTTRRCCWATTSRSRTCPRPTGCETRSASGGRRSRSSSSPA